MDRKTYNTLKKTVKFILDELYTEYMAKFEDDEYLDMGVNAYTLAMDHNIQIDIANLGLAYLLDNDYIYVREKVEKKKDENDKKIYGIGKYHITTSGIGYLLSKRYNTDLNYFNSEVFTTKVKTISTIFALIISIISLLVSLGVFKLHSHDNKVKDFSKDKYQSNFR